MTNKIILNIHQYLSQEIDLMNQKILSMISQNEEMTKIVSQHLINSGGKRIRPILTILAAKLFNIKNSEDHIKLAAAVEFIHVATLLHDDVIDDSNFRHSEKTANYIWGNKVSILVGDCLFSQAFKLMVETKSLKALELLSSASAKIVNGEIKQLNNTGKIIDLHEYYSTINSKTASLFAASCAAGAVVAGADDNKVKLIYEFGMNLGIIFQIKDDLLDYFAADNKFGKKKGQDLQERKMTIPLIILMDRANGEDSVLIISILENNQITQDDIEKIINLIIKYDVEHEINQIILNYKIRALEILELLKEEKKYINEEINILAELLNFSCSREY